MQITYMSLVPPVAIQLIKLPVETWYDLSSLHVITCGAAALSKENTALLRNKFKCLVVQGYGKMGKNTPFVNTGFVN